MVDLSKIKPGDEVTVRAVVTEVQGPLTGRAPGEAYDLKICPRAFVSAEWIEHEAIVSHTPKALAVGDRVKADGPSVGEILAAHGEAFWVKWPNTDLPLTYRGSGLVRADD